MKIPSTRGLFLESRQLDRATRENKRAMTAQMAAILEALAKSQSTLNPNLSDASHNRDIRRHIGDFIIL